MKCVFLNYFEIMDKTLYISAFFNLRYKNSAYRNMSKENIFLLIHAAMIFYKESIIFSSITTTNTTTITL